MAAPVGRTPARARGRPGGVRLRYAVAEGVEDALRHLAALEGDCCAWAAWRVDRVGDRVVLEVTAGGDGADVLRSMFAAR